MNLINLMQYLWVMSVSQLGSTNLIKDLYHWPEVRQSLLMHINKFELCVAPIGNIPFNGPQEYD